MTVLALEARDLRKSYGPTVALDGVSLAVTAGAVHALIGENGAGKSTLVKILSGIVRPDSGSVVVRDQQMPFGAVKAVRARGLRTAFQELSLVGDLTVTENFLLGEEPLGPAGLVRRGEAERHVAGELERHGLGSIDPRRPVRELDLPARQKIEIARAVSRDPAILLLDEPTASLSGHDVEWLGSLIRRLSGKGTAILFISHRMPEVREFCSRITILRNGRNAGDFDVAAVKDEEVIAAMIGRPLAATYPPRPAVARREPAPVLLSVRHLATSGSLADVSLDLPRGEILGVAGLEGMGQRELFLALFGMADTVSGEIHDEEGPLRIASPKDAIGSKIGISLVPEDRKTEGLFLDFDGRQNAALPSIERHARFGLVSGARQDEAVGRVFEAVQVPERALWSPARVFSGGNQQKIVLAKWLLTGSRILLLYDPTRGVDIGTKAEIYALMRRFVDEGGAILFYSTEIPELVHLCDSVAVLYRGRITRHLEGADITETAIMRATLGESPAEGGAAMTALVNRTPRFRGVFLRLRQGGRGVATSFVFLVLCLLAMHLLKPGGLTYFDVATIASSAAPLVLAALGQAVVVIGGGLDLSAGAVISLVNVVLVTVLGGSGLGLVAYTASAIALALALGAAMGMINGALVGYLGLQPVVVTLAVMFIVQGAALLLMPVPGGEFSEAASMVFVGDAIPGLLSAAVIVIVLAASAWLFFRNTRFGIALYAIGSDAEAAAVNGIDIRLVRFASYAVAGAFYGWAGLAISANTGSADPLIGAPMLLRVFAAVVLGGIVIGGGRGNAIGAVFGALILTIITSILLFSGIQTYYVPVVEGAVLLAAVLLFSVDRTSPAFTAWRRRPAPRRASAAGNAGSPFLSARRTAAVDWRRRVLPLLGFLAPAYVLFAATLIVTAILYGSGFSLFGYLVTLLVFTTFLAILGLGQGAVVISGGLDLSVAWSITLPAVILTVCANGSDTAAAYAIPLALLAGIVIGLVNGALVVGFRLSPIIVTLAIGGVLEGGTLIFSGGAPTGYAPPVLAAFVNGRWAGLPPIVWFLLLFAIAATLLLNCTVFGHRLAAVGKNAWIARLSGVEAGRVTLAAYVLSGFCSALVGVLLAGFNSQANYDMGKPYLLASIAVVVLGGTDIRGGRGHYLGILGGALLFTALGSMLSATALPEAVRGIVYGVVLLAAVLAMRKR